MCYFNIVLYVLFILWVFFEVLLYIVSDYIAPMFLIRGDSIKKLRLLCVNLELAFVNHCCRRGLDFLNFSCEIVLPKFLYSLLDEELDGAYFVSKVRVPTAYFLPLMLPFHSANFYHRRLAY